MTWKAVGLGIFLAFVFGAANAYLGMKAGQTVAATIPAAVIAMALFNIRGISRRHTGTEHRAHRGIGGRSAGQRARSSSFPRS